MIRKSPSIQSHRSSYCGNLTDLTSSADRSELVLTFAPSTIRVMICCLAKASASASAAAVACAAL
jgi:hypothetical protein